MDLGKFQDLVVDGQSYKVIQADEGLLFEGRSVVRYALVSDTVAELETPEAATYAMRSMLASVARRNVVPKGFWVAGFLPTDHPTWRDHLAPAIGDQVAAQLAEINGHVRVYVLLDSEDLTLVEGTV